MIIPSGKPGTLASAARLTNDLIAFIDFSNDYGWEGNTANDLLDRSVKYSTPAGFVSVVSGSTAEPGYIQLDGSTDYLVAGKSASGMMTLEDFTIEAWVYPGKTATQAIASFAKIPAVGATVADKGFIVQTVNTGAFSYPRVTYYTSSLASRVANLTGITLAKDQWSCIFLRNKVNADTTCNVTGKIFKPNGISAANLTAGATTAAGAITGVTSSNALHIGSTNVGSASRSYWQGNIGSVKIYNRRLTNEEIEKNYNQSKKRYGHS